MNKPKMMYFEKEDILHFVISDEPESDGIELSLRIYRKSKIREICEIRVNPRFRRDTPPT